MIPQLQKAMTLPKGLTAAILVFLMLAAAITTAAAASGTPQPLSASLPENSPAGASLGTPMETTAPAGTVSYSLSGQDAGLFDIDPATGEITLAQDASPDFETRAGYSVTITAAANLAVSVENVDEPGSVSLSANSPRSGEALSASLTDPDGSVSALSWRWQRSTEDGWEDIPGATAPDYTPGAGDVGRRLQAVAAYDDGSGEGRTAQAATGEPVRNDPPEFGADTANLAVDENTAPGAAVGDPITAADPNGDDVTYSLSGGGEFIVDPQTGQISVAAGAALDHEAAGTHSLTLRAEDIHGRPRRNIRNRERQQPGRGRNPHPQPRRSPGRQRPDRVPRGPRRVHIQPDLAMAEGRQDIQGANSGSHTATSGDVGHVLSVSVSYTDGHGPGKSAEASTGSAVGNDAPAFPAQTMSRAIDENAPAGAAAGAPVTAADPNGDPLTYSMTGAPGFSIDRQTGQIRTASAMDHEARPSYAATVTATDAHGATPRRRWSSRSTTWTSRERSASATPPPGPGTPSPRPSPTPTASPPRRPGSGGGTGPTFPEQPQVLHRDAADLGHTLSVTVSYKTPRDRGSPPRPAPAPPCQRPAGLRHRRTPLHEHRRGRRHRGPVWENPWRPQTPTGTPGLRPLGGRMPATSP